MQPPALQCIRLSCPAADSLTYSRSRRPERAFDFLASLHDEDIHTEQHLPQSRVEILEADTILVSFRQLRLERLYTKAFSHDRAIAQIYWDDGACL